jgi:hypothetical protein
VLYDRRKILLLEMRQTMTAALRRRVTDIFAWSTLFRPSLGKSKKLQNLFEFSIYILYGSNTSLLVPSSEEVRRKSALFAEEIVEEGITNVLTQLVDSLRPLVPNVSSPLCGGVSGHPERVKRPSYAGNKVVLN